MANLTIVDTVKAGWITIQMNSYYPSRTPHEELNFRKTNVGSVDKEFADGTDCVEMHISQESDLYLTYLVISDSSKSYTVDSVNGAAPVSINDLRDKILALL